MKRSTLFRFFVLGLLVSMGLGTACFFALRTLIEISSTEERRHFILFLTQTVENGPFNETIQENPRSRNGRRTVGSSLWVVSQQGQILAANPNLPLPISWDDIRKPVHTHDFTFHYSIFRLVPDLTLVKMDSKDDVYLLIASRRPTSFFGGTFWIQLAFLFFVAGIAMVVALGLLYTYLRRKSAEARWVLSRLEKGDLKARFEIKRIDEIGTLMLDFNRMASEIERLVHRVQETEMARKNLLEELSHDLRTPLTSLKASIEMLSEHLDEMPRDEQREFLNVAQAELGYFLHLIEDLFFIADLGEPRYKQTTQIVNLSKIVSDEAKSRVSQRKLRWESNAESFSSGDESTILGDPILIQRLLKNALDNAAKNARTFARIQIQPSSDSVVLSIEDDGHGISDAAIASFGVRKKQRLRPDHSDFKISLGLGSVIMKTIIELHGGELKVERADPGTRLILKLPKE